MTRWDLKVKAVDGRDDGSAVAVGSPAELISEHAGTEAVEIYGSPTRLAEVERVARERGWRTRRTATSIAVPLFLVAGTFFPLSGLPRWAQIVGNFTPLFHCIELVRHAVFGFRGWVDVWHLAFLIGFALIMWRLAVRSMERKLIL